MNFINCIYQFWYKNLDPYIRSEIEKSNINVHNNLYDKFREQILNRIIELTYKSLACEYHRIKAENSREGINKEDKLNDFYNVLIDNNYLSEFNKRYPLLRNMIISECNQLLSYLIEIYNSYNNDKDIISKKFIN